MMKTQRMPKEYKMTKRFKFLMWVMIMCFIAGFGIGIIITTFLLDEDIILKAFIIFIPFIILEYFAWYKATKLMKYFFAVEGEGQ